MARALSGVVDVNEKCQGKLRLGAQGGSLGP
jgi:hypothetical protein